MITIYAKNGTARCQARKLTLSEEFMGVAKMVVDISSPEPIDFAIDDYIDYSYNSRRYLLKDLAKVKKQARRNTYGEAFVYTCTFYEQTWELENCPFLDLVPAQQTAVYSSLPDVTVYAKPQNIVERVQANLDSFYGANEWEVLIPNYITDPTVLKLLDTYKDISLSQATCKGALDEIYKQWGLSWIFVTAYGRKQIYVAFAADISNLFKYGKGQGLRAITVEQKDTASLATRIYPYGSTENLPARWYNEHPLNSDPKYIDEFQYIPHLMLPPSLWHGGTPAGNYVEDADAIAKYGLRPKTIYFEGGEYEKIMPSISGLTAKAIRDAKTEIGDTDNVPSTTLYPDSTRMDRVLTGDSLEDNGVSSVYEPYSESTTFSVPNPDEPTSTTIHLINEGVGGSTTRRMEEYTYESDLSLDLGTAQLSHIAQYRFTFSGISLTTSVPSELVGALDTLVITPTITGYLVNGGTGVDRFFVSSNPITLNATSGNFTNVVSLDSIIGSDEAIYKVFQAQSDALPSNLWLHLGFIIKYKFKAASSVTGGDVTLSINSGQGVCSRGVTQIANRFTVKLRQIGFDIMDCKKSANENRQLNMKSGLCAGYSFNILKTQYNSSDDSWTLTCYRTTDTDLKIAFPNADRHIVAEDEFVLTGIEMPDIYVYAAMEKLYEQALLTLAELSKPKLVYAPDIDNQKMAASPQVLHAGMLLQTEDTDLTLPALLPVDSLQITEDGEKLREFSVSLRNEKTDNLLRQIMTIAHTEQGGVSERQVSTAINQALNTYTSIQENEQGGSGSGNFGISFQPQGDGNAITEIVQSTPGLFYAKKEKTFVDLLSEQTVTGKKYLSSLLISALLAIPTVTPSPDSADANRSFLWCDTAGNYAETPSGGGGGGGETLTVTKNGQSWLSYNGSQAVSLNLVVPTKVSDLTNDTGFITSAALADYLPLTAGSGKALTGDLYFATTANGTSGIKVTDSTNTTRTVLSIEDGGVVQLQSSSSKQMRVYGGTVRLGTNGTNGKNVYLTGTGYFYADNNTVNLGSSANKWTSVWATTLNGNLDLSYLTSADDLKAIEALTGTSGFLKKTITTGREGEEVTWSIDTSTYLTSVAFADLTAHPTTLSGYGITDAYTKTEADTEYAKYLPLTAGSGKKLTGPLYFDVTSANKSIYANLSGGAFEAIRFTTDGHTCFGIDNNAGSRNMYLYGKLVQFTFGASSSTKSLVLDTGVIRPGSNSDVSLGTSSYKWKEIYATTFYGNLALSYLTGADDLKAIEALSGTSGLLKKTAANTWALDTNDYVPYYEIISSINSNDQRKLWMYETGNTLWAADLRYDVTMTGFATGNAKALFNGSFDDQCKVNPGETGVITIAGKNGSRMWDGGYPYGYLEVAFYWVAVPESISVRVYSDYDNSTGWHNITMTNVSKTNNTALYRGNNSGVYGVTQVEITIVGKNNGTSYPYTAVGEIAFYQSRGKLAQMAVFNKSIAQTLYYDLTGTKFIVSGGTSSQFLKADGSLDSTAYLSLAGGTMSNTNLVTNMNADLLDGLHSHAQRRLGNAKDTLGTQSIAYGNNAEATGNYSAAVGLEANASNSYSLALGYSSKASGSYATSIGRNARAIGDYSFCSGSNSYAYGNYSTIAGGYNTYAGLKTSDSDSKFAVLVEYTPEAITYGGSTVYGIWNRYNDASSVTFTYSGTNYTVTWPNGTPTGWRTLNVVKITGDILEPSTAFPWSRYYVKTRYGHNSYSITIAQVTNLTDNIYAIISNNITTEADFPTSRPMNTSITKVALWTKQSNAIGLYAYANGAYAVSAATSAITLGNSCLANGAGSIAMGQSCIANGSGAISIGNLSVTGASYAIALGVGSAATNGYAIAMGAFASANAQYSVAIGRYAVASHTDSKNFALWGRTNENAQTVLGKYNTAVSGEALVVGWGTADNDRKNIMTVSTAGVLNMASNILPMTTNTADLGSSSKKFKNAYLSGNLYISAQGGYVNFSSQDAGLRYANNGDQILIQCDVANQQINIGNDTDEFEIQLYGDLYTDYSITTDNNISANGDLLVSGLSSLYDAEITHNLVIPTSAPSNPSSSKSYLWVDTEGVYAVRPVYAFNQLVQNGDFTTTSPWTRYGSNFTLAISNGVAVLTVTAAATRYQIRQPLVIASGHKAYYSYYVRITSASTYTTRFAHFTDSGYGQYIPTTYYNDSAVATWTRISGVVTTTAATTYLYIGRYNPTNSSSKLAVGDTVEIKNVWITDLTEMYGEGNEPTVAEFEAFYPGDYYDYQPIGA